MTPVFRGWVKTSLLEFPGRVCTVAFTGGCNLRCPFCHNPDLVLRPETLPASPADDVLAWLASRSGLVSALFVSGGEPTIHPWLDEVLRRARSAGVSTGVATNGTEPDRLGRILDGGLVDFVALDVKTVLSERAYAEATGSADPSIAHRVSESLQLLMASPVPYELRCTVVPAFHTVDTLVAIAAGVRGARRLVFQEFRPAVVLDPAFRHLPPMPVAELQRARDLAAGFVGECRIRHAGLPARAESAQTFSSKATGSRYSVQTAGNVVE